MKLFVSRYKSYSQFAFIGFLFLTMKHIYIYMYHIQLENYQNKNLFYALVLFCKFCTITTIITYTYYSVQNINIINIIK